MLRSIYFYLAVCCAALALANVVWAQPGKSGSSGSPMPMPRLTPPTPMPKATTVPMDLKILPKKTVDLDRKIVPVDPKASLKLDPKVITKVEPKVTTKLDPKVVGPLVLTRPASLDKSPTTPGLKLAKDVKFDVAELAKIKPPVDLAKTSGDKLVKMKPPADFKIKPTDLAKIHIPADALKVGKLNAKFGFKGEKFILNAGVFKGADYHLKYGVKCAWGYCYHGHHHCHWHHCIWDPCCSCYYYYDPCCSCYYYWCESDVCYYPCWWFVDYCGTYYPWWVCGGFEHWGYHCHPQHRIHIRIGW